MLRKLVIFAMIATALLSIVSCSTTRLLSDGEYRLASNKIEVTNDKKFNENKIQPYIKQKSNTYLIFGWNPFLNLYNWSGRDAGKWGNRVIRKIGEAPVVYDSSLVDASVENIGKHLEYLGYYDSNVDAIVHKRRKLAKVKYEITLGKRFPISAINYNIPHGGDFEKDFYADTSSITVRPGDYLSEEMLEKESERSAAYFRQQGYFGMSKNYYFFQADTLTTPGSAVLEMKINEYTRNETESQAVPHRKFYFDSVSISYPKSLNIRHRPLKKLNAIRPGDMYSEAIVNRTYSRMSAIRVFSSVNVELTQSDTNKVSCNINLTQSHLQGFKTNFEFSTNSNGMLGFAPEISFYHKNIFRGGEWLNIGFLGNFQFKPNSSVRSTELGASVGLSFPKFVFLPYRLFKGAIPRTDIKASYNYQDRPEYTRNIFSLSYGYVGSHKQLYYQAYPIQANIVRLQHLDPKFYASLADNPFMRNSYQNHLDIGSGGILYLTTSAESNPKVSYKYARLSINVAGNVLSAFKPLMRKDTTGAGLIWNTPYSQYVRAELTLGRTWRFGPKDGQAVAIRILGGAGHAYGNSKALPFEQHFYSGGGNSLRGWQARTVGPGKAKADTSFVIPNQTGDMKLEANVEYRFHLFWKLDGAAFIDAGNIWTLRKSDDESGRFGKQNFFRSIAADWGLGLRLDLNFLLLRVDMGMKMHDPSHDSGHEWIRPDKLINRNNWALHFGVGYPF